MRKQQHSNASIVDPKLQHGFRLGECVVHPLQGLIERPEGSEHVQPKVMEVLLCLAERPGEVVERDELVDRVWGKTAVTDEVLTRCISELRGALGDSRDHPKYVQTIPKRGYRLVTAVTVRPGQDEAIPKPSHTLAAESDSPISSPQPGGLVLFFKDLKRRKVFKVATAYAVVSWVLLQVAELMFEALGFPPWAMKFSVALVIFGFPIAALCAWAFQISPEGKIIIDLPQGDAGSGFGRRQADLFVIAVLSVSVGLLIYVLFVSDISGPIKSTGDQPVVTSADDRSGDVESPTEDDDSRTESTVVQNSIAVLRFENIGDPKYRYISDGISEELSHRFAKLSEMFVASRTIAWGLPDKPDLRTIRERLRVRYVLEGSVRFDGEQLRVTTQLIDTETGFHRWSESYDREISDILEIEDQVAVEVVGAVGIELSSDAQIQLVQRPTESIGAYILYLRGLAELRKPREESSLAESEKLFDEALEIDSRFVLAYAGLCEVHLARYRLSRNSERFEDAERACHRALTLDSTIKEVYTALGNLYRHSGQFEKAEMEFTKALELDPNDEEALYGIARSYQGQDRLNLAEETLRSNIQVAPGYWGPYMALGYFLHQFGRYEEAIPYFRRVTELTPNNPDGYTNLGSAYYDMGDWESAEIEWRRSVEAKETAIGFRNLGTLYYYNDRFDEAAAMHQKAIELAPNNHWLWGKLAAAYRYVDDGQLNSRNAYNKAIELAKRNVLVNPDDARTLAYLAAYYINIDQIDKARDAISRAIQLEPGNPEVWYFSAIVNVKLANHSQVLRDLEKAVNLGYSTRLIRADPQFDGLSQNEEFLALVDGRDT